MERQIYMFENEDGSSYAYTTVHYVSFCSTENKNERSVKFDTIYDALAFISKLTFERGGLLHRRCKNGVNPSYTIKLRSISRSLTDSEIQENTFNTRLPF